MTELNCEDVCIAAMAIADGERSQFSSAQIEAHLSVCLDCSREVEQLKSQSDLLNSLQRRRQTEQIWPDIERVLPDAPPAGATSRLSPFLLLGLLLLTYKLVEMIPDRDFGAWFKLVPLLFVIALFSYLRENPFKINAELRLEGV